MKRISVVGAFLAGAAILILVALVLMAFCAFSHQHNFTPKLTPNEEINLYCIYLKIATTLLFFGFVAVVIGLIEYYHSFWEKGEEFPFAPSSESCISPWH